MAFVLGPNYNKPWDLFDKKELESTLKKIKKANSKAKEHASESTELERALIDAVQVRVPRSLDETSSVSYTHLTLPTNREV